MPADGPKPKVTFVCEGLVTAVGGAERVLCEVASHLAGAGYDVDVVTHEKARGAPFFPLSDKVRVRNLRPPPEEHGPLRRLLAEPVRDVCRDLFHGLRLHRVLGVARLGWYDRQGGFRRRLERYLRENRRDVAIAFMPRAIVALGLARLPYPLARIASTHTAPTRDFDEPTGDNANVATQALTLRALHSFDRITVLLPEFQAWYPPDLRPRTAVVPNAVAPRPALPRVPREQTVLAVGRHLPVKGHDILIDAWARIAPEFPGWRLEIHGRGPDRPALEAQIASLNLSGSVSLMGVTSDMGSLYARAAMLVHPSHVEGFSLVVAEALAAELPAIGFADCPGVNALIRDGENGLLVGGAPDRRARVAALAEAMRALMSDPDRRAALGGAGPASVTRFAPARVMDLWERLIAETCRAQGTSERR